MTVTRLSTAQLYARPASLMAGLTVQADTLQTQIATGKKLVSPSSDPAAYRQLQSLSRSDADDTASAANVKLAQGILTAADSALDSVETQLQRAQELAMQAANGTLSDSDRQSIAESIDAIRDDLYSIANSKDSRGQPLFGGATGDTAYVEGEDGTITFAGTGDPPSIPIGDGTSVQPSESGAKVFAVGDSDVFAVLKSLSDALKAGGDGVQDAAAQAAEQLNASADQVAASRASIGARSARLDLESDRLTQAAATREASRSALEDTDVSSTITELQKVLTVLQATQSSFTKLTNLSLFDYLK